MTIPIMMKDDREFRQKRFLSCHFWHSLQKAQEATPPNWRLKTERITHESTFVSVKIPASYRRHPGLPVCHEQGEGSLIPHLPDVGGKGVRTSSKLGHGRLSKLI
ncbi:hypothetical protein NXV10_00520 [Bacteroides thetaiotaomicron]|nr:hypothetical protein [Bacteroides thetaiotaomicron]